jgi:hypothetical protein
VYSSVDRGDSSGTSIRATYPAATRQDRRRLVPTRLRILGAHAEDAAGIDMVSDTRLAEHQQVAGARLQEILDDRRRFERSWLGRDDPQLRSMAMVALHRLMADLTSARLALILDALCSRKLRWEPEDACLAIDLALTDPTYEPLRAAVRIAGATLDRYPQHHEVVEQLRRVDAVLHLDRLHESGFFQSKLQPLVERLIASSAPGGLLDLTVIELGDRFGEPARAVLTGLSVAWDGLVPALAHLGEPRGGRAPARWRTRNAALTTDADYVDLVRTLLQLAATTEATPGDQAVHGFDVPSRFLFRPGNELIVRAAVWATRDVEEGDWIVPVVSGLCERAAEEVTSVDGLRAMSPKVAYAAADILVERGARSELRALVGKVVRPDVLRRLAPHDPALVEERMRVVARERRQA